MASICCLSLFFFWQHYCWSEGERNINLITEMKKEKMAYIGFFYLNKMFGNILKSSNVGSVPIKTFECGTKMKVYELTSTVANEWYYVEVNGVKGHFKKDDLSADKPECFKTKYPKFYDQVVIDAVEQYYWGVLSSRYIQGETKVKLK